jgi:predicted GIY-YIG superfamily endonuclease
MSLHALYRFFDEAGDLLYVGVTMNPVARWKQHSHEKTWWTEVAHIAVEPHSDRAAVMTAERVAITTEKPRYNKTHNGGPDASQGLLRWQCVTCAEWIEDKAGYLTVNEKDVRAYEVGRDELDARITAAQKTWQPVSLEWYLDNPVVRWMPYHRACDPDPDDSGYWVGVERLRTHSQMLSWTAHLMSKTWLDCTDWEQVIYYALRPTR